MHEQIIVIAGPAQLEDVSNRIIASRRTDRRGVQGAVAWARAQAAGSGPDQIIAERELIALQGMPGGTIQKQGRAFGVQPAGEGEHRILNEAGFRQGAGFDGQGGPESREGG